MKIQLPINNCCLKLCTCLKYLFICIIICFFRTLTRLASTNLRPNNLENLMQEFIVNLGVGVNRGPGTNMQVILGNPADYAWGRGGLDAIVTELLNQLDTSG